MTCLFWFEKTAKLKAIGDGRNPPYPYLVPDSLPTPGFQKWATTILSTTQVSQNVILMALLFIYRMKMFNPGVKGKKGSECRLLTICLMLGNKFLDDNTYTNKTWAEVSGISVQEVHIMEVEFLSNSRYNLFVSKEEWEKWHVKLSRFARYCNDAGDDGLGSVATTRSVPQIAVNQPPIPNLQSLSPSSRLPSPPYTSSIGQQGWGQTAHAGAAHATNGISSYLSRPQQKYSDIPLAGTSRKRGRDDQDQLEEQQQSTKRMALPRKNPVQVPSSTMPSVLPPVVVPPHMPMNGPVAPRLPSNAPHPGPQLPTPNGRHTIPSMYGPASTSNWVQPMATTATVAPTVPSITSGLYGAPVTLHEPVRPQQQQQQPPPPPPRSVYDIPSTAVSPAGSAYSVHTPRMNLSPSVILANRNSPYRPVRAVNTLLIPPPSTSFQPQRSVPFEHMHYQPLGKPAAESKAGLLPYLHHGAWPQGIYGQQPFFHPSQSH